MPVNKRFVEQSVACYANILIRDLFGLRGVVHPLCDHDAAVQFDDFVFAKPRAAASRAGGGMTCASHLEHPLQVRVSVV